MQIIKTFFKFIVFLLPSGAIAQNTYLPLHSKDDYFIERQEMLQQTNSNFNFSSDKPLNRKIVYECFFSPKVNSDSVLQNHEEIVVNLNCFPSELDRYNKKSLLYNTANIFSHFIWAR